MATKVLVLAGDNSPEREISLLSGAAVARALEKAGYQVTTADPADGLDKLLPDLKAADVVFPALHGAGGENGKVQEFLEQHQIKFVGSGSRASALCFNKHNYDRLLVKHDILTPKTVLVGFDEFATSSLRNQPFVLKPNEGGSSIDNIIVRDINNQDEVAIWQVFNKYSEMLMQELIVGTEITVAVLDGQALPAIEIVPPDGQEFDYKNKYSGATREICPPEHVSQADQATAQKLAVRIHELCGCRDMSRTDIIVTPDSKFYVLETNTIPGMTDESLLPKAAGVAGINMPELCDRLVKAALAR